MSCIGLCERQPHIHKRRDDRVNIIMTHKGVHVVELSNQLEHEWTDNNATGYTMTGQT